MRGVKVILITLTISLVQTLIAPVYTEALSRTDIAYNEGKTVGESSGQIYGQKDYINGQRSNWLKAYDKEEKIIIDDYNLKQESSTYRFYFLRGFKEMFKSSYENGYRDVNRDTNKTPYDIGKEHGGIFGAMSGETYGKKDYYEGKTNNWKNQIQSDTLLIREYSLNDDVNRYVEGFLLGYKVAFEQSYNNAYRETNVDVNRSPKENGILHGIEIGFEFGSLLGKIDFADNKSNNWESALPTDLDIMIKYKLMKEVQEYRDGFLVGFRDGFRHGYIESFQDKNIILGKDNINNKPIAMLGGELVSADGIMKLIIEPGTIYEEKYMSVQKHDFPSTYNANLYIPTTNSYSINIGNLDNVVNLYNPITLTFKYYGREKGGIYKLTNNQWKYLYSNIKEGEISTSLNVSHYDGGIYAVFIDNNYKELKDVHNDWAGEEIYTFIRRNYISGYSDNTFRPDANISRAEFITLLSRVMNWSNDVNQDQIKRFSDYNTFGAYGYVITQAVSRGLINGYPDNSFKPSNKISYQEIEWIIQRLLNNDSFKWEETENKMLYEKYKRSKSFTGKENNITRAEVVYMLYNLENERKI